MSSTQPRPVAPLVQHFSRREAGRLVSVLTRFFGWRKDPEKLTPMGPLVKLRLIHENLLPEDLEKDPNKFQGINNGWPAILSSLKSLLETGEPITFSAP